MKTTYFLKGLILVFLGILCTTAYATNGRIYVSTSGSNSNNGQQGSPLLTIARAVTNSTNGDTIVVLPGSYREIINFGGKNLTITSNYMFVKDTNIIANTILDFTDATTANGGLYNSVVNNNDKKIYGLTITKAPKRAIATIAKLTIEYCVFKGNGYNDAVNNTDVNHLIGVLGTAIIDNCDFYNNENNALIVNNDRYYNIAKVTNTKIHHNNFGALKDGIAFYIEGQIDISNCAIYKNKGQAIFYLGGNLYYDGSSKKLKLNFNTIVSNEATVLASYPITSFTNFVYFSNSIVAHNRKTDFILGSGTGSNNGQVTNFIFNNNVLQNGLNSKTVESVKATNNITSANNFEGTPLFIDSTADKYTLAANSLGMGFGYYNASQNIDTIKKDIVGTSRSISSKNGPDIGAYQSLSTAVNTPTNLTVTTGAGGSATLSWTGGSSLTNKNYNIYRSTDGSAYTKIGTSTTNTYNDNTVLKRIRYYYKVSESFLNIAATNALDTGMVNFFSFTGNANDYKNANLPINNNNANPVQDRFSNATSAYSFNGTNQYLEYDNTVANVSNTQSYTVTFWGKGAGNYLAKYSNLDASQSQFFIASGTIAGNGNNSNSYTAPDNNWNHYMVIMENGSNKTKVYRNGSLISTGTILYSANGTATNFTVGRVSGSPPGFLNGSVDDIRVYNSVLSSSKLNNIYAFESQYGYTNIETSQSSAADITVVGRKIYVNKTTGSNSNAGTLASPLLTIQAAINLSSSEDTVVVSDAIYSETLSITSGKNILITSNYLFDKDSTHIAACVIDGTNFTFNDIQIASLSDIFIQGITLKNVKGKLIDMANNDLVLKHVRIRDQGFNQANVLRNSIIVRKVYIDSTHIFNNKFIEGIVGVTDTLSFTNSKFYNNQGGLITNSNSGFQTAILLEKSLFQDNTRATGASSFGEYMFINVNRHNVIKNKFINNSYTVFGGSGAAYTKFINNLFLNNTTVLQRNPQVTANDSVILIHNSFIQNAYPSSGASAGSPVTNIAVTPWTDMTFFPVGNWKGIFYNNIFYGNMSFSGPSNNNNSIGITLKLRGNLFKSNQTFSQAADTSGSSNNQLFDYIQYVDTAAHNFRFANGSRYLRAGVIVNYPANDDINGTARPLPVGTNPEPGAFESSYSLNPPVLTTITAANKSIKIDWTATDIANITSFRIYRDSVGAPGTLIDTVLSNKLTYTNTVVNGTRYYYRIKAFDIYGLASDYSNILNATAVNVKPVAATLSNKTIDSIGFNNYVKLKFSGSTSSDADGTISSYKWYVNDSLVNDKDSVLNYNFSVGSHTVKLKVLDNDNAVDSSAALVKVSSNVKTFAGGFIGGISAVSPNIIYTADSTYNSTTGATIYKLNGESAILNPLSVIAKIATTPSVSNDSSLFVITGSSISAFDKSGTALWPSVSLGALSYVTPTVDSLLSRIYVGVSNKDLYAINYKTGKVEWTYTADAPMNTSAVITGNRKLIVTSEAGTIYGFDIIKNTAQTAPKWTKSLGQIITGAPALDNKNNVYFGTESGNLLKTQFSDDGEIKILWTKSVEAAVKSSPVIDADGFVYVANTNGDLFKLDSATGDIKWKRSTGASIVSTPAISEFGSIYVANMNGIILSVTTDNVLRWSYNAAAPISANILYINNKLYVGTQTGKLITLYDNPLSTDVNTSYAMDQQDEHPLYSKNSMASLSQLRFNNKFSIWKDRFKKYNYDFLYLNNVYPIAKDPIWGTYQGNYKRTGANLPDCPEIPTINIPNCIEKADSIVVNTNSIIDKVWIINDAVKTDLQSNTIKIKATDKVGLRTTSVYGCVINNSTTASIANSTIQKPVIISSSSSNSICEGDSVKLSTGTVASNYTWLNSGISANTNSVTIKKSGTYTLSVVNEYGCKASSDALTLVVNKIPATPVISRDASGNLISTATTNEWYKDGVKISETTNTIKPSVNGTYTVKASENNCISTFSGAYYFVVTDIININNNEFIKMAPNPFVNDVNIDFVLKNQPKVNIEIYSMSSGNLVKVINNVYAGSKINLENLSAGMYIFKITTPDQKNYYQFKMIKL